MAPEHVALVKASWQRFEPVADEWMVLFYQRLFQLHPESRALFAMTEMTDQPRKFARMLGCIVLLLGQPDHLVEEVARLGRRHQTYGVRDGDYASMGAALLWTLEQAFGADWTPELQAAWAEAFLLLSWVMRRAAQKPTGEFPAIARSISAGAANGGHRLRSDAVD